MEPFDLNLVPVDLTDQDDPLYCTQNVAHNVDEFAKNVEGVDESPDPETNANIDAGLAIQEPAGVPLVAVHEDGYYDANGTTPASPVTMHGVPELGDAHPETIDVNEVLSSPQEPFVGMRFDTLLEARRHYNAYAHRIGFSMKSNTNRRSAYTNELEKQQFVCNKFRKPKNDQDNGEVDLNVVQQLSSDEEAGDDEELDETTEGKTSCSKKSGSTKSGKKRKRETIKQTNCKARMVVKLIDNKWQVTYFLAEHNHPVIKKPSLMKYLRSHKGIPREEKDFLKTLHDCNLETGRMMQIMSEFYGSGHFVPYTTKDISNFRSTIRLETKESDMPETIAYFMEVQKDDPDFYFRIKLDNEDRVQNLFWVDGLARRAYEHYFDCISFDTTFLTNIYNMPFAPFIGINRHGQSFMLGCGFLRDEKQTSFDWLLETFLDAMRGKAPLNIITDQDWAMRGSIDKVFGTNTVHRNCRWHIMKKAQEKLGSFLGRRPGLSEDIKECVDFSMLPEEFETKWASMIEKYDVGSNTDLYALYRNRETWVPCYFRHRFFPFLQSTQRSEGFNAVLKRYVNPHNSILNFVKQYEKIQEKILVKEGGNDYRTDELDVRPWSPFPIEKQALSVYTRNIYYKFQKEFEMIGRYNVRHQGGNFYLLVPNNQSCPFYGSRNYLVTALVEENNYSCECCKYERDGLLCCHILKVFTHCGIDEIPQHYILTRWTQAAIPSEHVITEEQQADNLPSKSQKQIRYANLSMAFAKLAKLASVSDGAQAIAQRHIRDMQTKFNNLNKTRRKRKVQAPVQCSNVQESAPEPPTNPSTVRNPPRSSTKGRLKARRHPGGLELKPKKKNMCSLCSSKEHNAATCPSRLDHPT